MKNNRFVHYMFFYFIFFINIFSYSSFLNFPELLFSCLLYIRNVLKFSCSLCFGMKKPPVCGFLCCYCYCYCWCCYYLVVAFVGLPPVLLLLSYFYFFNNFPLSDFLQNFHLYPSVTIVDVALSAGGGTMVL